MSLPKAERTFQSLLSDNRPEVVDLLENWEPSYSLGKTSEAIEAIARFKALDIDPRTRVTVQHNRVVTLARAAAAGADVAAAASAFVRSTNAPQDGNSMWLNPLRSISKIRQMPKHAFSCEEDDLDSDYLDCSRCGETRKTKWCPVRAAWDVRTGWSGDDFEVLNQVMVARWFSQSDTPEVTDKDVRAFKKVLSVISDAPQKATTNQISKLLRVQIKGSIEWSFHLETLGFAGVLKVNRQPGNLQQWVDFCDRKKSLAIEMRTPACHWRRGMGFDEAVFAELFPDIALPRKLRG